MDSGQVEVVHVSGGASHAVVVSCVSHSRFDRCFLIYHFPASGAGRVHDVISMLIVMVTAVGIDCVWPDGVLVSSYGVHCGSTVPFQVWCGALCVCKLDLLFLCVLT